MTHLLSRSPLHVSINGVGLFSVPITRISAELLANDGHFAANESGEPLSPDCMYTHEVVIVLTLSRIMFHLVLLCIHCVYKQTKRMTRFRNEHVLLVFGRKEERFSVLLVFAFDLANLLSSQEIDCIYNNKKKTNPILQM